MGSTPTPTPEGPSGAEVALAIANIVNTFGPRLIGLIAKIRNDRGEEETVDLLAEARAKIADNIRYADEEMEG